LLLFSLLVDLNFAGDDGEISIDVKEKENLVLGHRDIFTFTSIPDSQRLTVCIKSVTMCTELFNLSLIRMEIIIMFVVNLF
jgi:hypothetical protein